MICRGWEASRATQRLAFFSVFHLPFCNALPMLPTLRCGSVPSLVWSRNTCTFVGPLPEMCADQPTTTFVLKLPAGPFGRQLWTTIQPSRRLRTRARPGAKKAGLPKSPGRTAAMCSSCMGVNKSTASDGAPEGRLSAVCNKEMFVERRARCGIPNGWGSVDPDWLVVYCIQARRNKRKRSAGSIPARPLDSSNPLSPSRLASETWLLPVSTEPPSRLTGRDRQRQTDGRTDRPADRQTDRQTD